MLAKLFSISQSEVWIVIPLPVCTIPLFYLPEEGDSILHNAFTIPGMRPLIGITFSSSTLKEGFCKF